MVYKLTESEEDLLDEIKDYTGDTHSDKFFIGKIKQFGVDRVRGALSETEEIERQGKLLTTRARRLTYMLRHKPSKNNDIPPYKAANKPTKTIGNRTIDHSKIIEIISTTKGVDKSADVPFIERSLASPRETNKFLKVEL
ncbi:hypothetical protein AGMMS49936_09220 [Endomicrobiia bacterium]|nr:hypothetical protein AGMMS49936_09220 [Endomicrobiia bacterium]